MRLETNIQESSTVENGSLISSQAQNEISQQEKFCANPSCGKTLFKKKDENSTQFKQRRHCNHGCAKYLIGLIWRGKTKPRRAVKCPGCKEPMERAVISARMRCDKCFRKKHLRGQNAHSRDVKERARRYRILMTALGFDSFEEVIAYLKTVPWAEADGRRVRDLRGAA